MPHISTSPSPKWAKPRRAHGERAIWIFFVVQLLALTVFQKIGLPTEGIAVSISIPLLWTGLLILVLQGLAQIDVLRLFLFSLFVLLSMLGHIMIASFSVSSLALIAAIYIPMFFTIQIREELYLKGLRFFVNLALLMVPIIFLQWGLQYLIHPGLWFNVETLVPSSLLVPGYFYQRFVSFGSAWIKPNGIFFLETSILSQILALAIAVELVCFRDIRKALVLTVGLISTTAGTGVLLLALCSPLLLRYLSARILVVSLVVGVLGTFYFLINGIPLAFDRLSELSSQTESGYYRFVAPYLILSEIFDQGNGLWYGAGAGNAPKSLVLMPPFAKLIYEYGLLASVSFYAYLIVSMFRGAYSFTISLAVFIFYNLLGGGLAVPFYGIAVIVLTAIFRVTHHNEDARLNDQSRAAGSSEAPRPGRVT